MQQAPSLKDYGGGFLLLCLLLALLFGYLILQPFLSVFFVALVLASLSYPAYQKIVTWTGGRQSLSALLACVLVVLVLIVPGVLLLGLLAKESAQAYEWIRENVGSGVLEQRVIQQALDLQKKYLPKLDIERLELGKSLTDLAATLSGFVIGMSTSVVKAITTAVGEFFLMLVALYYFYKDGPAFVEWVMRLTPLPGSLVREIVQKFRDVSESALYGTFLVAIVQGFLGGIGFLIVGLPPLIWGVVMALFSLIPLGGTALVWGPAAVILMLSHRVGAGIFLILWGVLVVSASDNILRPLLMKGKSQLHPLLIFFSLIGGMLGFGPLGIFLGPLAMVLIISMLRAYEAAARPLLEYLDGR